MHYCTSRPSPAFPGDSSHHPHLRPSPHADTRNPLRWLPLLHHLHPSRISCTTCTAHWPRRHLRPMRRFRRTWITRNVQPPMRVRPYLARRIPIPRPPHLGPRQIHQHLPPILRNRSNHLRFAHLYHFTRPSRTNTTFLKEGVKFFSEGPKFFRGVRVDLPAPSRPGPALEQGICHHPGPARKPGGTFERQGGGRGAGERHQRGEMQHNVPSQR